MSDVVYTDPDKVSDVKRTDVPVSGHTVSGYGGKIPTSMMIRYDGRWHRVLVMIWSNAGTAYIRKGGKRLVLDIDTEHRINAA